ncbi:MAG: peroxiredoxin [Myxococcales bacterium]|nr:peroxiredoxin [Myxococcales bacterium]
MTLIAVGSPLPPFRVMDDRGNEVTEADWKDKTVVLYFYPKDDTPGCTREACGFRDGLEAFTERGASVYGVSADDGPSHERFRDKFELNHPLLADVDRVLCQAFGVWGPQEWKGQVYEGIARSTFVVKHGQIAHVFPNVDPTGHPERVLAVL